MATDRDRTTRERAYHLWIEGGRPDGLADEHWHQAEREVGAASEPPAPKRRAAAKTEASDSGEVAPKVRTRKAAAPPSDDPVPAKPRGRSAAGAEKA